MRMLDRAHGDRKWIVRLGVMGVVAALLPLVSGRAQVPKDDNAPTGTTKTFTKEFPQARPREAGERENLDAEIEKARSEAMRLEEETEEKYSEFKKSLRKFERAEDRLAELEFRAGRGGHRALTGLGGHDPFGGMAANGQGMDPGQGIGQGMAGMNANGGGMSPVAMHWMMELNEKIEWLHDEVEDLKRERGGEGAPREGAPRASTTTTRER